VGNGVDCIAISRIEKAMARERFISRNFTEKEQAYFAIKGFAPETVAAHFAAKEAFAKALGTGIRGFSLCQVEVLHDELGKPYFSLHGEAREKAEACGIHKLHVSLTHTEALALAFVVAEGAE